MSGFDQFMDFTRRNLPSDLVQTFETNLRQEFGGDKIMVPKRDNGQRNQNIRAEYDGRNIKKLASRYGLSESQINKIVS